MKKKIFPIRSVLCIFLALFLLCNIHALAAEDPPGGPGESVSETYTETSSFDKDCIAVIDTVNAKPLIMNGSEAGTVTIEGAAPNRTATIRKEMMFTVQTSGNKATLSYDSAGMSSGEPGSAPAGPQAPSVNYIYVDNEGNFCCTAESGNYAQWTIDANGQLYYDVNGTPYYFAVLDGANSTVSTTPNTAIAVFSGTKDPGGMQENESNPDAPVFTLQPDGYRFTTVGGGATFRAEAVRTTDDGTTSDGITYQWYLNGSTLEGETGTTLQLSFASSAVGTVNVVYCEATYSDGTKDNTTNSTPASYIVAAGQTNDYLLFSDIHQEPENIANVLQSYMVLNQNMLPQIVLATGDYTNTQGESSESVLPEQLQAIDAMLGGLKTYYLAGNHESSTLITNPEGSYNKGTGCIANEDVYIYTINYDEIGADYSGIVTQVETFLSGITEPKPVLFIAHAGLHTLDNWNGEASYNIDFSDRMVDVLNQYGKNLSIFFFFGHDHSKGETEFLRTIGDTLTSTFRYSDRLNRTQTLNFTYGHMGYLNMDIGGQCRATVFHIGLDSITTYMIDSAGKVEGIGTTVSGAGRLDVPVVASFAKSTTAETTLCAEVSNTAAGCTYTYEWYIGSTSDTSASDAARIENETGSSYLTKESDIGKYIFCTVRSSNAFATTTATKITEKPSSSVSVAPQGSAGLIYNGSAQALIANTPSAQNGVIQYAVGTDAVTAPTSGWSESAPQGTDAGTYFIWYKSAGNSGYKDSEADCLEVTVRKAAQNIFAPVARYTTATAVILTAQTGYGAATYGCNTENAVPDTWQDSTVFFGLRADTDYYFFAQFAGDKNHEAAVSIGTEITTNSSTDSIRTCDVLYDVNVVNTQNGTVTVDGKKTYSGNLVTLTVEADRGWTLETITVTDLNGKEIALTPVTYGETYTFRMPACNVTVTAIFMEDNTMLNYFVDVTANDYYYDAVLWAAENGITAGMDNLHFAPGNRTTRAQVVTFLWRAAGCPEPTVTGCPFTDVPENAYYYKAVLWAVEKGITLGVTETTFMPNAVVTRAQTVTFLWRYNGKSTASAANPFTDVKASAYYYEAVLWAVENSITSGIDATAFSPTAVCTRGQIVTFLYRNIMV